MDDFSTLSERNQFFTLHHSNVLIFPASVKLVPTCAGLLGTQLVMMRFGQYETKDCFAGFCHENETIMIFKLSPNESGMN